MSIKLMNEVWDRQDIQGSEKLVMLALADQANDAGICWPGVPTIARRASIERRQAQNILGELETKGYITRIPRAGTSNLYHVHPPDIDPAPAPEAKILLSAQPNQAPEKPQKKQRRKPMDETPPPPAQPAPAPAPEQDDFSRMQALVEQYTGVPLPCNEREIQAVKELVNLHATEADLAQAIQFFRDNGRVARGAANLINSVRYAVSKRTQASAPKAPAAARRAAAGSKFAAELEALANGSAV